MFVLNHILRQSVLDEGATEGAPDNSQQQQQAASVLDDSTSADVNSPNMNVEQFLAGFSHEEKESASTYASKFSDNDGNLDVSKMIKSGYNLEGKFGSFTGAPESYELATPDYLDGDVNLEDPYLQEFMGLAKESNMSQDSFAKFMDIHLRSSIAPPVDIKEMEKAIGPEFNAMRSNMAGFFKSRLDDDGFKAVNGMINSPETFQALYSVYKASKPTKIDDTVRDSFNHAELKDQMEAEFNATDDHGNPKMRDPVYSKSWRERWTPYIQESDV